MESLRHLPDQSAPESAPATGNRRCCVRHRVHSPAYVSASVNFPGTGLDLNEVLDISEAGISFQAAAQMQVGPRVKLCLDLPETAGLVWAIGRVVWSEPSGRTGVHFLKLRGAATKLVKEWLFVNALVACAHSAAVEARAANREPFHGPSLAEVAAVPPPEEIGDLDQADYAALLARIAAIRREVESPRRDLESSLELLAEQACAFTNASGAAIALAIGEQMICRASAGSSAPPVGARFQLGAGFSGECVRTGVWLRCDDSESDARVDRESCRALGIRSLMAVPIRADRGVAGLLEVFSGQPSAFGAKDRIFLQRSVDVVLAALDISVRAAADENARANGSATTAEVQSNPLGFEESTGGEVLSGEISGDAPLPTDSSGDASFSRIERILLVAAAALLVLSAALLFPRVRNRIAHLAKGNHPAQAAPQLYAPKILAGSHSAESELDRLRRLAQEGDASAQFALGAHYAIGDSVPQDYSVAAQWFTQAANQGHVVAQATLGAYYWAGTGVPKDLDRAYFWSVLAQAGGDEGSKYRVSALAAQMSRGQIINAQDEANDWLRQHQLSSQAAQDSHP